VRVAYWGPFLSPAGMIGCRTRRQAALRAPAGFGLDRRAEGAYRNPRSARYFEEDCVHEPQRRIGRQRGAAIPGVNSGGGLGVFGVSVSGTSVFMSS
jgi:hypothetical protein